MAALLGKARRSAILRRARRELALGRESALEQDRTPPPVSVVFAGPDSEPGARPGARSQRAPAAGPRGLRRLVVGLATMALFVGGALAVAGAPWATASTAETAETAATTVAEEESAAHAIQAFGAATDARALAPKPFEVARQAPPEPAGPRADAHVNRAGYAHIPGGVVFVPSTFSSADGAYDLYLHFHGNTRVVLESAEVAGLNAIVAVVNLGVNSAPYLDGYEMPGTYERTLGAVGRALGERGLDQAKLRRVAIGSWSGGYGAISRILEHDTATESLDAVLVLDGIHCGFLEEDPKALNVRIISPFLTGARRAAEGDFLFSITHSEIDPGTYAGTAVTAGYLLEAVRGTRGEPSSPPEHLQLRAGERAVSKRLEKRMEPTYEATVGMFHVRGYRGNTPEHHMSHLLQMGATVMPELAERWRAR